MFHSLSIRPVLLGLTFCLVGPVLAQQPAKKSKYKLKATAISQAPAAAAPQPVSPAASAPQAVLETPGAAPKVAATAPSDGQAQWLRDLAAAQAQAKATQRPVVAVFSGSDWCKPCIMYGKEVFDQPEFAAFAKDRLVLAHFDFPRLKKNQPSAAQFKLNEAAAAQLNREGDFPLAVVLGPEGQVLAKTGYIAGGPAAFIAYLHKVVPGL